MQAVNTSDDYVITAAATRDLELLAGAYASAGNGLSNFERTAILRGIEAELADRRAQFASQFEAPSETERLAAALELQEERELHLQNEISDLEEEIKQLVGKNGKAGEQKGN